MRELRETLHRWLVLASAAMAVTASAVRYYHRAARRRRIRREAGAYR